MPNTYCNHKPLVKNGPTAFCATALFVGMSSRSTKSRSDVRRGAIKGIDHRTTRDCIGAAQALSSSLHGKEKLFYDFFVAQGDEWEAD
uniref:Uncharacterized protein n=1 Tax=Caenorhabditis japonica TaxID=281687 RepID=A0A8R1ERA9_CAEJA